MTESKIQEIEGSYDDRKWWQVLEDEIYLRPLTYYELKGEFENLWKKEYGENLRPEDWYRQVEHIRDWYSGEQYEPTEQEARVDTQYEDEVYRHWDAMDALLESLERPPTFEDSKQQRGFALDRQLTKKELQKEKLFFEEWLEYRARVSDRVAEATAAWETGFKALYQVLFCLKEDGSPYSDDDADPVIKQHMTLELWTSLTELLLPDEEDSASARAVKGHAKRYPAIEFVKAEWAKHRTAYRGNKSEFARAYSRRVLNEHGVKVTDKQIREVWLKNPPIASNPDGMQATG